MEALNSREWAVLLWLTVAVLVGLLYKAIRTSMFGVVKAFLSPKIIGPLVLMTAYIWLEAWLGSKLLLWNSDLTKDTIVWAVTSGLVLFFKLDEATTQPKFFRRRVWAAFKITVFIEVFINLFVLSLLPAELILQPFLVLVVALSALNPDHRVVKKLMDGILSVVGFGLLFFVARHLITNWHVIDKGDLLLQLLLPVWLSIGLLPFMYVFALYANYEMTFLRIRFFAKSRRPRLRAYLALIIILNFQTRKVGAFSGQWLQKLSSTRKLRTAFRVVADYRKSQSTG